jgi:hypothetical protein
VAGESGERKRSVLATIAGLTGAVLLVLVIGTLWFRPATLIGVNGDALAYSVGGKSSLSSDRCSDLGDSRWQCFIGAEEGGGGVDYLVETRSFGCWDATRTGPAGEDDAPKRASGCIGLSEVLGAP